VEASLPLKSSVPEDGASTHPRRCSNVDLPHPEGPVMAVCSPARIESVTSRTAKTGPAGIEKLRVTFLAVMMSFNLLLLASQFVFRFGSRLQFRIRSSAFECRRT
jgi:hypothetical protein